MDLAAKLRVIPDFPSPGISFKDITPILQDPKAWQFAIDSLKEACQSMDFDLIVAPEARGFILGSTLAYAMGKGFAPVRKAGKLPGDTVQGEYLLEYGTDSLELHRDAVKPGQRVLIIDDVLATGGTIAATIDLVKKLGGVVAGAGFLIELNYLQGRDKLDDCPMISVLSLDS